jgi:NADH dehydrogenase FAD-containing subunit
LGKHLVLAGGGHAHLATLANMKQIVREGHRVTVIGPSPYHYYSGMGPGMLGGTYLPEEIRFSTKQQVEQNGGVFLQDRIQRVIPDKRQVELETGAAVSYDVISFNTGSDVSQDIITLNNGNIYSVKPIEKLAEAKNRIHELLSEKQAVIDIIGGGPASAEIAGNIRQIGQHQGGQIPKIRIFSSREFMPRFSERVRLPVRNSLMKRGIEFHENSSVQKVETGKIVLSSGEVYEPDLIFLATGVKPSPIFQQSGLPVGPDGGLLVNRYLQSKAYPEIFGGGDCIFFEEAYLDKVGVYAVRENPVLYHNLFAALSGRPLKAFEPGGDYLLIFNLGGGIGVLQKKWFTLHGKIAFILKDYIDRKFMKRFQ